MQHLSSRQAPSPMSVAICLLCCAIMADGVMAQDASADATLTQSAAADVMHKIIAFYREEVGYQGAYLWRYSSDLTRQEGEEPATRTSGWTEPPGTPTVGDAYLRAWRYCGDLACLDAAVEAAHALVRSQLKSGGWAAHFDLAEPGRQKYAYRVDGDQAGDYNYTTFDDNKSQSALTLLMHVDEALEFKDPAIHEAVDYALRRMLTAQYPNGAWPQQYREPHDPSQYPVKRASYPQEWSRAYEKPGDYRNYYTLNDNNMSHIIDMLFEAHRIYSREDCRQAAERTGDFFLLAQMPDPQPGWAQQYDLAMHPAWARKFEPAAITGGESQGVMRDLINLYRRTGQRRFLEPLPKALAYYQRSRLPDGRLARFYELRTNRPLYFTKDYRLTYRDDAMPTHYGFQVSSRLDDIEREYQEALATPIDKLAPEYTTLTPIRLTSRRRDLATALIAKLDERGAWVEPGRLQGDAHDVPVISMKTFCRNLPVLAQYVGAEK